MLGSVIRQAERPTGEVSAGVPGTVPRAGMLAEVRNRSGVVTAVEPFDGEEGRLHLVHVEYKDSRAHAAERLLWELEPGGTLLEPNALPDASSGDAMDPADFDALLRAARWTALTPYLDFDGRGAARREPLASPFHGAVRPEDYQLVPLLKALRMPRVSLLIADDVGLGKTIEAGLILTELLLRRRIRRVLVLAPAALRRQWRDELWEKFSLRFEVVDRHRTELERRRLGMAIGSAVRSGVDSDDLDLIACCHDASRLQERAPIEVDLRAKNLSDVDEEIEHGGDF